MLLLNMTRRRGVTTQLPTHAVFPQVGIAQMPKDPFMMILHSSFLMDVLSSYQSGYSQLQVRVALMHPPPLFVCDGRA